MLRLLTLLLLASSAVAAEISYVAKLIACEEKEEEFVSHSYDAFLALKAKGELKKEELRFPSRLAIPKASGVIISRAFYVSPNELRGFEIFVPEDCVLEKNGVLISATDLEVQSEDTKQGITCIVLKRKSPTRR